MTARDISACVSTLILGCVLVAPTPAHAQRGHVFTLTRHYDAAVTASPNEMVHVTIVNPKPDPAAGVGGNVEFEWKVEEGESSEGELGFTIEPGEARTFTLDPRAGGQPLDGRSGLRRVVEGAGLAWEAAEERLGNPDWRDELERNRVALYEECGLWGVPSYRVSGGGLPDWSAWGQDRLWRVAQEIRRRAATGR